MIHRSIVPASMPSAVSSVAMRAAVVIFLMVGVIVPRLLCGVFRRVRSV